VESRQGLRSTASTDKKSAAFTGRCVDQREDLLAAPLAGHGSTLFGALVTAHLQIWTEPSHRHRWLPMTRPEP
jgi:hypothetical protein